MRCLIWRIEWWRRRAHQRNGYANDWPAKCNHFAINEKRNGGHARKFFAAPWRIKLRELLSMRSVERMRTISAQARVAVVRNTPKPCIHAINAINPLRADAIFFDAACWMIASPLNGQTPK